jgi:hypothetical protein
MLRLCPLPNRPSPSPPRASARAVPDVFDSLMIEQSWGNSLGTTEVLSCLSCEIDNGSTDHSCKAHTSQHVHVRRSGRTRSPCAVVACSAVSLIRSPVLLAQGFDCPPFDVAGQDTQKRHYRGRPVSVRAEKAQMLADKCWPMQISAQPPICHDNRQQRRHRDREETGTETEARVEETIQICGESEMNYLGGKDTS